MFGKGEWFQPREAGGGLRPSGWQAWMYLATWLAVMVVPFVALVMRQQAAESLIWGATALALFAWDLRLLRRECTARDAQQVLFIDADGRGVWRNKSLFDQATRN